MNDNFKPINQISWDTFVLMQATILANYSGGYSDRHADAYYQVLETLKVSGVTHVGLENVENFK